MNQDDPFSKRIASAKAYLRITSPFFAALCESCPIEQDTRVKTACVDESGFVRINPGFLKELNVTQTAVLLCHEVMHPAWGVFWRSKDLSHDPVLSNIAHDHVINLILSESHSNWSLPGWLCDPQYKNMSYEEVYCDISRSKKTRSQKSPCGPLGLDIQPRQPSSLDSQRQANSWKGKIATACQSAWVTGSVPAAVQRAVSELIEPQIDWKDWLFSKVGESVSRSRQEWALPSRRSDGLGIPWPSETSMGVDISVAIDTSGSIREEDLLTATSEIMKIAESAGAECRLIVCDSGVKTDTPLRKFDPTILRGGGGTNFIPVFEHLEQHPPRLLIYFTDAQGKFPDEEPPYYVVWAVYEGSARAHKPCVPFGEVLMIPSKN